MTENKVRVNRAKGMRLNGQRDKYWELENMLIKFRPPRGSREGLKPPVDIVYSRLFKIVDKIHDSSLCKKTLRYHFISSKTNDKSA